MEREDGGEKRSTDEEEEQEIWKNLKRKTGGEYGRGRGPRGNNEKVGKG